MGYRTVYDATGEIPGVVLPIAGLFVCRALVVEGVVEGFQPMRTGHDAEHFTVRGVRFSYSNFVYGQGFNQTTWAGGPMREGLRVRIHYTLRACGGGCADIQKLEIAE